MGRNGLAPRLGVLGAAGVLLCSFVLAGRAAADDSVPTPAAVATPLPVSTSDSTPVIATDVAPVATEAPTSPAPVTRERFQPVSTQISMPTVGEGPAPTAPASHPDRPFPTSTPSSSTSGTQTSSSSVAISPPPYVPLPSPEQLRENARLRWGKGVPPDVRRWAFLIVPAARKYHLNPGLIAAVMTMESGGDPLALSPAGAVGLMQVLNGPWDPKQNVYTGARMLAEYHDLYPDWTLTLAAYNAGPDAVSSYGGVPPFRETRDYVIVVTYLWDLYSHKHLTVARQELYHATLKDLQRFSRERKKVARLARIAHIHDIRLLCAGICGTAQQIKLFANLDPFWPIPTSPDPLQRVDPYTAAP